MSETIENQDTTPPALEPPAEPTPVPEEQTEDNGGRAMMYTIGGILVVTVVIPLVCSVGAIAIAYFDPDAESFISAARDVFIILLAWFSILIGAALVVLILQIASLFNLIKNELIPIIDNVQKTTNTVRGTSSFMSQNLVRPVIRATGFFAYVRTFFKYLGVIRRAELDESFIEEQE
jgi:hypothetical protein